MNPHTLKWTPIVWIGVQMDSRIFKVQFQGGQNPLVWRVLYIIGKLLKRKCLKWAHMTHLDIWNTSYGQKRSGVKLAIWLPTIKSWELTRFPSVQATCDIPLEGIDKGYDFALGLIVIKGLHVKLCAPKVARVPTMGISGLPLGNPKTKCHLNVPSWRDAENIIRGKVVASLKFGSWWVLWVRGCPWLILAPKVPELCTNQLFVWFVSSVLDSNYFMLLGRPLAKGC